MPSQEHPDTDHKRSNGRDGAQSVDKKTTTGTTPPENPTPHPPHHHTHSSGPIESHWSLDSVPEQTLEKWAEAAKTTIFGAPQPIEQVKWLATFVSEHGIEELSQTVLARLHPQAERLLSLLSASRTRSKGVKPIPYVACPPKERELLFEWRPILQHHEGLRAFTQYLLHYMREAEQGGILVDRKLVLRLFGFKRYERVNDKIPGQGELLLLYRLAVCRIEWSGYHPKKGIARTIKLTGVADYINKHDGAGELTAIEIPQRIVDLAEDFVVDPTPYKKRVNFMTGAKMNRHNRRRYREKELQAALDEQPTIDPPERSIRFRDYMNRRDGGQYRSMKKNVGKAVQKAKDLPLSRESKLTAIRTLRGFEQIPNGVYALCDYSPRIKAYGTNQLMNLKSELRKELYGPRHVEMDLSKAQAAAAHYLWEGELKALEEHLVAHREGEIDLWDHIGSRVNLRDRNAARTCAKRAMYGTVFGGETDYICLEMLRAYQEETGYNAGSHDPFRSVLEHPVLKEMLQARGKELRKIEEDGGRRDVDGRWIDNSWFKDRNDNKPERNVLAYAAQSVEQFLMESILMCAENEEKKVSDGCKSRPNFQVILYQADGVTIQLKRDRRSLTEKVVFKLRKVVSDLAAQHGIITTLGVESTPNK
jgi:hypothetical protein